MNAVPTKQKSLQKTKWYESNAGIVYLNGHRKVNEGEMKNKL